MAGSTQFTYLLLFYLFIIYVIINISFCDWLDRVYEARTHGRQDAGFPVEEEVAGALLAAGIEGGGQLGARRAGDGGRGGRGGFCGRRGGWSRCTKHTKYCLYVCILMFVQNNVSSLLGVPFYCQIETGNCPEDMTSSLCVICDILVKEIIWESFCNIES